MAVGETLVSRLEKRRRKTEREEKEGTQREGWIFACVSAEKFKWILTSLAVCADSMSAYCISAWKVSETKRKIFC